MSTNGRGSNKPTIVLIHGLWLTPRSWEGWIDRYQKAGYNVIAPSWPGLEGEVEAIRKDPSALKGLKLKTVVDHYDRIIRKLDAQPILMGHSFGGLIVQMLVDRGLGSAGILVDSAQTAGVPVLPFSTIRATLPILGNPFSYNRATPLSPKQFNYAFTNELDAVESKKVYDRYSIPAANAILWDAALALLNPKASSKVDYKKPIARRSCSSLAATITSFHRPSTRATCASTSRIPRPKRITGSSRTARTTPLARRAGKRLQISRSSGRTRTHVTRSLLPMSKPLSNQIPRTGARRIPSFGPEWSDARVDY
jgi:pimeloyl-ACP methyl ester carboxylesterase